MIATIICTHVRTRTGRPVGGGPHGRHRSTSRTASSEECTPCSSTTLSLNVSPSNPSWSSTQKIEVSWLIHAGYDVIRIGDSLEPGCSTWGLGWVLLGIRNCDAFLGNLDLTSESEYKISWNLNLRLVAILQSESQIPCILRFLVIWIWDSLRNTLNLRFLVMWIRDSLELESEIHCNLNHRALSAN